MKISNDDLAKLAVANAMTSALGSVTSQRDPDSIRSRADLHLHEMFENDGVDRIRIRVNGVEVGTLSAKVTKPKVGVETVVLNYEEFIEWLRTSDGGRDTISRLVAAMPAKVVEMATVDGELPDGCAVRDVCEPPRFGGTMLKVNKEKVAQALGAELPNAVIGLLGE